MPLLVNPANLSLGLFIAAYVAFVVFPRRRSLTAIVAAFCLLLMRVLTPYAAFQAINWNVMGIFVGTLVLADFFIESRMPAVLAEKIVMLAPNTCRAMLLLSLLTGLISAFVENVATVLIMAPIALALARTLKLNPTTLLIAMAVSSNLQGAATLIGDPPSMLLAGAARMGFMDFIVYRGRPGIFFSVQVGALASLVVLYFFFRRDNQPISLHARETVRSWVPTWLLLALVAGLACSSFFDPNFQWLAGTLCLVVAAIGLVWDIAVNRGPLIDRIKGLDWDTTFFLMGVFVLVGSLTHTGWTDRIADMFAGMIGANILLGYIFLIAVSVVISGFVDNVPFLAAMLPVVMRMAEQLGCDPTVLLFGLLLGASVGGNITPIGASANIVTIGILRREGFPVKFTEFMKIGLPFTIVAVAASAWFTWVVWGN